MEKGWDYHTTFSNMPCRRVMWELEKTTLSMLVSRLYSAPPRLLDFACGTGRIAAHLEPACASVTGIDISAPMLEVARNNLPRGELICADVTRSDALGGRLFDLITAFRFFPNAEPSLRADVIQQLGTRLAEGGFLIMNNHKNSSSLMLKVARLVGRGDPHNMSEEEVITLIEQSGLRVREAIGLGYLNWTDRWMLRPLGLALLVEKGLRNLGPIRHLAQNTIYVCSR
jgi:SAM-dependent methyltransferase